MLLQGFCFESAKTAIIKLHAVTASLYKFECAIISCMKIILFMLIL